MTDSSPQDKGKFSEFQNQELEKEFLSNMYLDQNQISNLAEKIHLEESVVTTWLKNRRNQNFSDNFCEHSKVNNNQSHQVKSILYLKQKAGPQLFHFLCITQTSKSNGPIAVFRCKMAFLKSKFKDDPVRVQRHAVSHFKGLE